MTCAGRGIRRALVAPLWVLMLVPSVAIPILDRDQSVRLLTVERPGHGPLTHLHGHDHNLCTQVRSNPPVPAVATTHRPDEQVVRFALVAGHEAAAPRLRRSTHRSRAPPAA